jgi:hypothetical protein
MTLEEEDESIQHVLANRDAAMAAAAGSTTCTATSEGTLVEREVEDADTPIETFTCAANSTEVMPTPSHSPISTDAVTFQPGSIGYPSNMS